MRLAAAASTLLHAGALLTLVHGIGRTEVGAIPQPSDAVSIEMVASRTLEALQPKPISEPAPSPEATAPTEGRPLPSEASISKPEPSPEREIVDPPPVTAPDVNKEMNRPAKPHEPSEAHSPPAPVDEPAEVVREPPNAKVTDEDSEAKGKEVKQIEKKAAQRAPEGGIISKAKAGKGTGSERATASRGSILTYAALVRARVASNPPSSDARGGTAIVAFGLTTSGGLAYARIARSSGNAARDQIALAAVRRAAPFPAPPAGATSPQLQFTIPYYFD